MGPDDRPGRRAALPTSSASDARYRALFDKPVIGIRISSVAEGGRMVEANFAY
jgi:hypothetical protein